MLIRFFGYHLQEIFFVNVCKDIFSIHVTGVNFFALHGSKYFLISNEKTFHRPQRKIVFNQ